MIDSLLITGLEYGPPLICCYSNICWFWDKISLLARKLSQEFCYSLFANPLVYNKHKKTFSGLCLFRASDATWKLHIQQAYFHFTCPIIQQFTAAEVTKPTLSIPLYKRYYFKNECEGFIRFPNTRKHLKPQGRR